MTDDIDKQLIESEVKKARIDELQDLLDVFHNTGAIWVDSVKLRLDRINSLEENK